MKTMFFKRYLRLFVFPLVSTGVLLSSCDGGKENKQSQAAPASYKTMQVTTGDKTLKTNYTASVKGKQYVEIRPQVSGVITEVCIQEGAAVRKGQTLFVIDQVPYKAALATAEANVESAQAKVATAALNVESRKVLLDEKVVAEYDLQMAQNTLLEAQAALAQMQAQLVNAQNNLSYTLVKSPVDGVASMIPYRVGALVSSSITEPLVTVSDDSQVYVYFSMNESNILGLLRENGSLTKAMDNMPEVQFIMSDRSTYAHNGKIDAVSGTVDAKTGAISMRATFPNPEKMLRNGSSGQVIISTQRSNCIIIPQSATYELQNKVFAYKVVDGKAQSTPLEVFKINDGKEYIVESGLQVGDVIIAEGAGMVRDGAEVATQSTATAAAAATPSQDTQETQKKQ